MVELIPMTKEIGKGGGLPSFITCPGQDKPRPRTVKPFRFCNIFFDSLRLFSNGIKKNIAKTLTLPIPLLEKVPKQMKKPPFTLNCN